MKPWEAFVAMQDAADVAVSATEDAKRLAPMPMRVMDILTFVPEPVMALIAEEYYRWLMEAR